MRIAKIILPMLALLIFTSCIDKGSFWRLESAVAKVGDVSLFPTEVASAIPKGVSSVDSAAFAALYVVKWTQRETKLMEAERLFASSAKDIKRQVEEYRRKVLLDMLDSHTLDKANDTLVTESQIRRYYANNRSQFQVDKPLVQFRLLSYDSSSKSSKSLNTLFASTKSSDREDLRSICEKIGYTLIENDTSWSEYSTLLSQLPPLKQSQELSLLKESGVCSFTYDNQTTLVKIVDYRLAGESTPFELCQDVIKKIIIKQQQNQTLLDYENELYRKALTKGSITFPSTSHIN